MSEFNNYDQIDSTPISSTEVFQQHLEAYSKRLSNAITKMRNEDNRVSFQLNPKIVVQIRELSELEGVSISEVASRLLTEYLTPEDSLGHWN